MHELGQLVVHMEEYLPMVSTCLVAGLLLLEGIQVAQLNRINRRLNKAGAKLRDYLDTVLSEEEYEEPIQEAVEEVHVQKEEAQEAQPLVIPKMEMSRISSRQETDMRTAIEQRKRQKDADQLLDSVLQEIFD